MDRQPIVAGQFYSDSPEKLKSDLEILIGKVPAEKGPADKLIMVPHAGYVFSGRACGQVIAQSSLGQTVILLGPNHTGAGDLLSVWPADEKWLFPGGSLEIDEDIASALVESGSGFSFDRAAHLREHSLEVVLPFLYHMKPDIKIVPVCVSENNIENLHTAGDALAEVVANSSVPVTILVSSDMSHYISAEEAKMKDSMALEKIVRIDPAGLYSIVQSNDISMCGVLPMTMALYAARSAGALNGRLISYTNSGNVTGDNSQVVAYAGVIIS